MTKGKLAIKLAIDIMERNVNKYINHGIYEVSDADGAVHVEFGEAINILNEMLEQQPCPYWDYGSNTCRHANIGALATKPCEDAVSRQVVLGMMQMKMGGKELYEAVYDLPSVTPIRPKGEWKYDKTIQNWRCAKCNETPKTLGYVGTKEFMTEHFKFCNHCGTEMVKAESEEA